MLLALDVGNTNITAGAFQGPRLARQWRIETAEALGSRRLGALLLRGAGRLAAKFKAVVYGSVVPALDRPLERALGAALGLRPLGITPRTPLGIKLLVDSPKQVGADRLLNALAAHRLVEGPAVVIDFGTATTFDCVSGRGDYLGGAILPGPKMAARALAMGTAKLPEVAIRKPRRAIGKNTVECIEAGVYFGYLGMIEKLLELTLREMPGRRPRILATGGLARLFYKDLGPAVRLAPDLTLQGLRLAHETVRTR